MREDSKIAMVTCQHFLSGIGNYSKEITRHTMEKYPNTNLFKPYKKGHLDESFHKKSWIKPIYYKSIGNLHPYILPFFIRKTVDLSADLFHAHWFLSGIALTLLMKKPTVITMHDVSLLHVSEVNSTYLKYYNWAIERFKRNRIPLIVVSESAKKDTVKYANYPEELVHVVYNGIDPKKYFPQPTPGKNTKKFTIIYSGGLGKRKNLELLLKAYKELEKKYDFLELKIAGAFPERTPYPQLANQLKLKNCKFTGFIPDEEMNNFYNSGDLMVYTSEYEGFGFAPLEAMACGVPVCSTNGGSLGEVSLGGACQIEYDVFDIVSKISLLIDQEEQRERLVAKGKKWVKNFTWEKCASQTMEVYKQLF
ncbi:glycosyltransferase family 4 protein [Flexithrix dorotheae]|uniref:glycosyltransferase family 4 protein n=1 Tax=Flexithrix dorotheae TaxID=70993 RepID=UPI00036FFEFE|nr:glycosyltransferase family 1 protein [Flexithrix dorotheae]